jgi:protein-L-isoaspartate(D-aspartate) O-methyltransferase
MRNLMRERASQTFKTIAVTLAAVGTTAMLATTAYSCARVASTILATGVPATGKAGSSSAELNPPLTNFKAFADYMRAKRGDSLAMLRTKWGRYRAMVRNGDLRSESVKRAFLLAPREEFARTKNSGRVYAHAFLSIGCGVTISGPHIVGRMTSELNIKPGEKVLEVGTGSGYQSSILSYLTDKVYTIEIIPPLARAANKLYSALTKAKYSEFGRIKRKTSDGYFGWKENGPFDKIIVTAGIDHIPPPLLKQLAIGGTMIIPVGPPGAQALLKVTKSKSASGRIRIKRHDIYASDPSRAGGGRKTKVSFVAFTKYDAKKCASSRWSGDRRKYGCK